MRPNDIKSSIMEGAGMHPGARGWGGRRRRGRSRQAADRAAEIRGRRASRGLCKNDIRGLRRAFSLVFIPCRGGAAPTATQRPSGAACWPTSPVYDRWFAETLLVVDDAPPVARAEMWR